MTSFADTPRLLTELGMLLWQCQIAVRRGLLNGTLSNFEAEAFDPEQPLVLGTEEFHEVLEALVPGNPASVERGLPHAGLPPTMADRKAHELIERRIGHIIEVDVVSGEEGTDAAWAKLLSFAELDPRDRTVLLALLDSIDGSGPQDTFGVGYSTNLLIYRGTGHAATAEPEIGIVVTCTGTMLAWSHGDPVYAAELAGAHSAEEVELVALLEPKVPVEEVRHGWVAAVAAQQRHREPLRGLIAPGSSVSLGTLGGAPVMPQLLLGRLHALVVPSAQSRHDAVPLLALAQEMGLTFKDLATGRNYTNAQVRGFFTGLHAPAESNRGEGSTAYRPVPAMIVARAEEFAHELFVQLSRVEDLTAGAEWAGEA